MMNKNHTFHLVEKSPWPLMASLTAFFLVSSLIKWFSLSNATLVLINLTLMIAISAQWWRDISREATHQGHHTLSVSVGMRLGMLFFIISEVMFFFSFFWAYYHSSLSPTNELGLMWPPKSVIPFMPWHVPLLNTVILLASGVSVTWAHHAILMKNHSQAQQGLVLTISLGLYFTILQAFEYMEAPFSMADSVYGSTFFISTGFHGLHVIIGSLLLISSMTRLSYGHFSNNHHVGLEATIWYWHFVDVVWLFLYISVYWWGL